MQSRNNEHDALHYMDAERQGSRDTYLVRESASESEAVTFPSSQDSICHMYVGRDPYDYYVPAVIGSTRPAILIQGFRKTQARPSICLPWTWTTYVFDWLTWGGLVFAFVVMVLVVLAIIFMGVADLIHLRKAALRTAQLLASTPDVPYKELRPAAGADGEDREDTCVICQATYEAGERCLVLPACKHMFHKACLAAWFCRHAICPLCRATVAVVPPVVAAKQQSKQLTAADNMV